MRSSLYILTLLTLLYSCISESFDDCPDYGKYRVLFTDTSLQIPAHQLYLKIRYLSNGLLQESYEEFSYEASNKLFNSNNGLKLSPGSYQFFTLASSQMVTKEAPERMRNGHIYLRGVGHANIIKSPLNRVFISHKLFNSLITFQCNSSINLSESVLQLGITPPLEDYGQIDLLTGNCEYERGVSYFIEELLYDKSEGLWYYYCNPILPGVKIVVRIVLQNLQEYTTKEVSIPLFLESGLMQGMRHNYLIDISANQIDIISSGIEEWEEIDNEKIINI